MKLQFMSLIYVVCLISLYAVSGDVWSDNAIDIFCDKERYSKKVDREGCAVESFVVDACLGNCRSYQRPVQDNPYFLSLCQGCRATKTITKEFTFKDCKVGIYNKVYIESAVDCACVKLDKC